MKIASSAVAMQSSHYAMLRTEEHQNLTVSVSSRPAPAPAPVAQAASEPASSSDTAGRPTDSQDWRLVLIKALVEWLTGKHIKLPEVAMPDSGAVASSSIPAAAPAAPPVQRPIVDVAYERHVRREEVEQTSFAAQGSVTTSDGRDIDLSLQLAMARSHVEESNSAVRTGSTRKDPLVLNLGGSSAQLSPQRMSFDLDGDGRTEAIPLLTGGGAYLALDANQNGVIDSGSELFGPSTGSGFAELARYDSDHNGWIDENDPAFAQLAVWQPDAEGAGKLTSLKNAGVGALFLGNQDTSFQLRDEQNRDLGAVRTTGLYLSESGEAGSLQQVDLAV